METRTSQVSTYTEVSMETRASTGPLAQIVDIFTQRLRAHTCTGTRTQVQTQTKLTCSLIFTLEAARKCLSVVQRKT